MSLVNDYLTTIELPPETLEGFVRLYVLVKMLVPLLVREGDSRESWCRAVARPALDALQAAG
jgi:hypothetical protein